MSEQSTHAFDHREAIAHITKDDPHLASLIGKCVEFKLNIDEEQSPYESLLRAIAYQSIAGKAAAVIFGRIKALGSNGRVPTPEELLKVPEQKLREAGFSAAKVAAARDLAQKTIDGIVPTMADAVKMSDAELVERLISVRGIGAWTVEMFLIFRLGRPDVLPIHDYGVQKGFALTYRKRRIPKPKELQSSESAGALIALSRAGICGAPLTLPEKTRARSPRPAKPQRNAPQQRSASLPRNVSSS